MRFASSEMHFALSMAPPKGKFWCPHCLKLKMSKSYDEHAKYSSTHKQQEQNLTYLNSPVATLCFLSICLLLGIHPNSPFHCTTSLQSQTLEVYFWCCLPLPITDAEKSWNPCEPPRGYASYIVEHCLIRRIQFLKCFVFVPIFVITYHLQM